MEAILFAFISAAGNTINSLLSSQALRSKALDSVAISLLSLFPAFIVSLIFANQSLGALTPTIALTMIGKNILYAIAFYLRFKGLANLGAFRGSLLAAAQPVIVSTLSLIFLKENLLIQQWVAVALVSLALAIPKVQGHTHEPRTSSGIFKYAIFPALLLSAVVVMDRWILISGVSPTDFFFLDKTILFPVVAITLFTFVRKQSAQLQNIFKDRSNLSWLVGLGISWAVASYTYGVSLAGEKTAIVTLIRNLAFPLAAVGSIIFFGEKLNIRRVLSLALVIGACVGALYH